MPVDYTYKNIVPYAVSNYEEIRECGYYYVDKTMFIPLVEKYKAPVFLRPRRFGKTLMLSVLECYYSRTKAARFHELFDGTWIGSHPTPGQGKYITIRFNFSTVNVTNDLTLLERNFNFSTWGPIDTAVYHNRDLFGENFRFSNKGCASDMLKDVLDYIRRNDLPPAYILIDEYDNFTNTLLTGFKDDIYERVTTGDSFLRTFFKTIKAGVEERTIRCCYCTGVLPVTMDDLTSGYNIAEIITLEPEFINMAGFTHPEVKAYLQAVLDTLPGCGDRFDEIWKILLTNYDSYKFLIGAEPLFNSTILSYFLKRFALNDGTVPFLMVDENLRTDIGWLQRLTSTQESAKKVLDSLLVNDVMYYDAVQMGSRFNKKKFFDPNFYPISLFYLGMVTLVDNKRMHIPNLTMRSIIMDYYNDIHKVSAVADLYAPAYIRFEEDGRLEGLLQNYFEEYLGQFPAQVFDKMNENFIRCSFYELVSRYLSSKYTFALEQNNPKGRTDFEMTGIHGTDAWCDHRIVEFKYFKSGDQKKIKSKRTPYKEDVEQVRDYSRWVDRQFPNFTVRLYVCYICSNRVIKVWEVSERRNE